MDIINKNLFGKVVFNGHLVCETGMHIGASKDNMEIGAINSPVVRDPITDYPYIPGSSLKGKLRMLLEKALVKNPNRSIGKDVMLHVCDDAGTALNCEVCRIFGSTGHGGGDNFPARLIIRDLHLTKESIERLSGINTGLRFTEWKFENAIDRVTSAANPRQIERVPRGAKFQFEIVYNVEDHAQISDDLKNIKLAFDLLQLDAIGGHGSRGYGKVRFEYEAIEAMTVEYIKNKTSDGHYVQISDFENMKGLIGIFKGTE